MIDDLTEHGRRVIERGSRSFALAARVLDPVTRAGAYQLYAWCRHCDDVIDGQTMGHDQTRQDPAEQRERLAELRSTTERAFRGEMVDHPVFRGIARTVERHAIPPRHPFEFLDGMAMDVEGRRYRTVENLRPYCYGVAGVVAVMMAHVMGIKDQPTLARAEDLGIALQFTNISRDLIDDARVGRVYLPLDWLAEAGIDPGDIANETHRPAVAALAGRLLERADQLYRRADHGLDHLSFRHAWSIRAARRIYAEIGAEIRRRGLRAWDTRTSVGLGRKVWLGMAALMGTILARLPGAGQRNPG